MIKYNGHREEYLPVNELIVLFSEDYNPSRSWRGYWYFYTLRY